MAIFFLPKRRRFRLPARAGRVDDKPRDEKGRRMFDFGRYATKARLRSRGRSLIWLFFMFGVAIYFIYMLSRFVGE